MSLALHNRMLNATWREGWARDAQFIPAWNEMTVAEAVEFIRAGRADPAPDLDAPLLNQIPMGGI